MVRHPVSRIISEYHYLRDGLMFIPESQSFSDWLQSIPEIYSKTRWSLDNHLRPICEMVPSNSVVFKLEDGLENVVSFLDDLANDQGGPRSIERAHQRLGTAEPAVPTAEDIALIEKFYSRDFDRFEYDAKGSWV